MSGLVLRFASQPSSATAPGGCRQFPKPAWQLDVQLPPLQILEETLLELQVRPQLPQLSTLMARSISQPSSAAGAAGRLQLPLVPEQVDVQSPALQDNVWTPEVEQVRPQAPQFRASLAVDVSQPLSTAGGAGVVQSP